MEQPEGETPASARASQSPSDSETRPTTAIVSLRERRWVPLLIPFSVTSAAVALAAIVGFSFGSIGRNLIANAVTTVVLICFTWAGTQYFYHRRRNQIFKFFGIKPELPSVIIYLSNLLVTAKGTVALEDIGEGYVGPAISKIEYEAALALQAAIAAQPMAVLPDKLYRSLGKIGFEFSRPNIDVKISPRNKGDDKKQDYGWPELKESRKRYLPPGTIIVLGSNIYNCIAKWCFDVHLPDQKKAKHDNFSYCYPGKDKDTGQRFLYRVLRGAEKPQPYSRDQLLSDDPPIFGIEPACVLRFQDDVRTIFLCAGIAEWSTANSVKYLLENWAQLQQAYNEQNFGVVLKFRRPSGFDDTFESLGKPELVDPFVL